MPVSTRAHAMGAIVAAAGVLLLGVADVLRGAPHLTVVVAARVVWAGALLGLAADILRARDRELPLPAALAAIASIAALSALAWADHVSGTGSISYLVAAPLFVALIVPDRHVAAVGAIASLTGTIAVGASIGLPAADVAIVAVRAAFAGAFAVFGSVLQERARRTELALAEERARAVAALAASERRRAEAEPLAAAGSRAAAAAHDMSGPIAAIRANLDWLDEGLRAGRVSGDRDVPAAVDDARAATEVLVRALSALRKASDPAEQAPTAAERPGGRPPVEDGSGE